MVGKNLTVPNDELQKATLDYLYNAVKSPKPEIEAQLRQLRRVYTINPKQYILLKKYLPYFVCGSFNPRLRKKENFAYTECFVVDIDKLQSKQLDIDVVRAEVQKDEQVMMCFKSPSEDGLKVLFRLSERCYDAGIYTVFYRAFVKDFASRHNLEQVVDSVTCDVSRACFISHDPDAYFNPFPDCVDLNVYVDINNIHDFMELKHQQDKDAKEAIKQQDARKEDSREPSKDVMAQIRATLNPKPVVDKPEPNVPIILDEIMEGLRAHIESLSIELVEEKNIQYGKKLRCKLGIKFAELNLFYGKRGFSFVKSPKAGTNPEFNDLLLEVVKGYIASL